MFVGKGSVTKSVSDEKWSKLKRLIFTNERLSFYWHNTLKIHICASDSEIFFILPRLESDMSSLEVENQVLRQQVLVAATNEDLSDELAE